VIHAPAPAMSSSLMLDVELVALGTVGERVEATSQFDGWGYAHLYRAQSGKLQEIDAYILRDTG
jgi:hypothetical protein